MSTAMKTITLERTGNRPLQFEGEEIAHSDTQWSHGKDASRWHELTLYREKNGRYFLHIVYKTRWKGELENHTVEECGDGERLAEYLQYEYDPTGFLVGYPHGQQFEEKQARLVRDITARYQHAVSELLADLPEVLE